jgi:hypothetical protein
MLVMHVIGRGDVGDVSGVQVRPRGGHRGVRSRVLNWHPSSGRRAHSGIASAVSRNRSPIDIRLTTLHLPWLGRLAFTWRTEIWAKLRASTNILHALSW